MTWCAVVRCTQNLRRDGCSSTWHQPCQRCKYTTSVDVQKTCYEKLVTQVEPHASAVSLLKRAENSAVQATINQKEHIMAEDSPYVTMQRITTFQRSLGVLAGCQCVVTQSEPRRLWISSTGDLSFCSHDIPWYDDLKTTRGSKATNLMKSPLPVLNSNCNH